VTVTVRLATPADVAALVVMNRHLIEDQHHDSTASDDDLERRMRQWITGTEYEVGVVELEDGPVAYAVWRDDEDGIYLRQFFVSRDHRRSGVGRAGFTALRDRWTARPVKLDVLIHNDRGLAFWRSLGFRDYSMILSLPIDVVDED